MYFINIIHVFPLVPHELVRVASCRKVACMFRRGFLWKGRKEANGGCCLVAWDKVMRPLELGGLGIHNLEIMGWALQMRWLWIEKTKPERPWEIPVHMHTLAMFAISVVTSVGNGENTMFWTDSWIHGC